MTTSFLFMAERPADTKAPPDAQAASLTGILLPSEAHGGFRANVLHLVAEAAGLDDPASGLAQADPGNLLPGQDDSARAAFLEGIASIIRESGAAVYRIGYRKTYETVSQLEYLCGSAGLVSGQSLAAISLSSILRCLKAELAASRIWPVMESAGGQGWSPIAIPAETPFDDPNLGDVLYGSKRSAHGAAAACTAYLLHMGWLRSIGARQTPHAERLADIAAGLAPAVAVNEVIDLKVQQPPSGYAAEGPIRFVYPMAGQEEGVEPVMSMR